MIDAVSSINPVSALQSVRKAIGTDEAFRIPDSALRTNDVSPAQGVTERDPIADSVELSRDFPQMFATIAAAYAPPSPERAFGMNRGGEPQGLEEESEELPDSAQKFSVTASVAGWFIR